MYFSFLDLVKYLCLAYNCYSLCIISQHSLVLHGDQIIQYVHDYSFHHLPLDLLRGHHVNQVPGNVYESLCKAMVVNAYWLQKTAPLLRAADKQCVAA